MTNNSLIIAKKLIDNTSSREILEEELNIKSPTFYKHLNLIKKARLDVKRNFDIYHIKSFTNQFKIENKETSILAYMLFLSFFTSSKKKHKTFVSTLEKLLQLCSYKDYQELLEKFELFKITNLKKEYDAKIKTIQKHIDKNNKIKLQISKRKTLKVKPFKINFDKGKIYLEYFDIENKTEGKISLENIAKITPFEQNDIFEPNVKETIFELYGKLSKSYLLKENERVIDNYPNKIVIASSSKDKDTLLKRLLRYDTLCKVLFPKEDVERFKEIIKKSLENINQFQDN